MQLLSQVFSIKMLYRQLITITLSIYKNFSLGFLCKALHNRPHEGYHVTVCRRNQLQNKLKGDLSYLTAIYQFFLVCCVMRGAV